MRKSEKRRGGEVTEIYYQTTNTTIMAVKEGKDVVVLGTELQSMVIENEEEEDHSGKALSSALNPKEEEEEEKPPLEISASLISKFLSACGSLDHKKIRELLEGRGLDPNALVDQIGQNGFHYAICTTVKNAIRQASVLKYLCKKGLDINLPRSSDGWTPIFLAVTFGLHNVVTWLLSKGAKINVTDLDSQTPEALASKFRMHKIKDTLIHHRSRVPHSRFSCVMSGPALSSPSSSMSSSSSQEAGPPGDSAPCPPEGDIPPESNSPLTT